MATDSDNISFANLSKKPQLSIKCAITTHDTMYGYSTLQSHRFQHVLPGNFRFLPLWPCNLSEKVKNGCTYFWLAHDNRIVSNTFWQLLIFAPLAL